MSDMTILKPALRTYRGVRTDPDRWARWDPRPGDVIVCTPSKSGTTWTQTIIAMLLNGGPDLPDKVPVLSPWIDADLGVSAQDVAAAVKGQKGRRVIKTHTPADGFPIYDGVTVIAVFRHPLDVYFSLRKHVANVADVSPDDPILQPPSTHIPHYLNGKVSLTDFDNDCLETITLHYEQSVCSGRIPSAQVFHYADMLADGRGAVARIAAAIGIADDQDLIDRVAAATEFAAMKASAQNYAPVGGTGFWKSDSAFFDSASSQKWAGQLSDGEVAAFEERLAELLPDQTARNWLKYGGTAPT